MTRRERMLAAYHRRQPDRVPVSPELWYDIGVQVDDACSWEDVCLGRYPMWRAQLNAHRYFGSAAWVLSAPSGGEVDGEITCEQVRTADGDLELCFTGRCAAGELHWRSRSNASYYDWATEHPIKDIDRDFAAFETLGMPDVAALDLSDVSASLQEVGDDGVVTPYVGSLLFSFIASNLEGGPGEAILAMLDRQEMFENFQQRYVARVAAIAGRIIDECDPEIVMLDNGYSTTGIVSPAMYEKWDAPVIRAVADVAHARGRLLHLHQHGKCRELLDVIVAAGADLVEPFERPPSGDTPDLGEIKRGWGERIAIRGNMHAHDTLLRGSVDDVDREARECIDGAAVGGGFILASGDGVITGTPHENIFRMVEAGEKYGRY